MVVVISCCGILTFYSRRPLDALTQLRRMPFLVHGDLPQRVAYGSRVALVQRLPLLLFHREVRVTDAAGALLRDHFTEDNIHN